MRTLTRRLILLAAMASAAGGPRQRHAPRSAARKPAKLARRHHQVDRSLSTGRFDRRDRAIGPTLPPAAARGDRDHREPAGGVGKRRHRRGCEVASGREHLAHRVRQPRGKPVRAAGPAVRHRKGSRSRPVHRHGALRRIDAGAKAVQDARRRDRGGEGQAGGGQLCLGRQRQRRSPRHGPVVQAGRRPARPRALSRGWPGHERRRRRPRRPPGRQHRPFHSTNSGRHHSGRGADRQGAYANAGRRADGDRERLSRIRGLCVVGRIRAGGHAQGDHRPLRRRRHRLHSGGSRRQGAH